MIATLRAASFITDRLGCREKRTTNAMPYPQTVSSQQQIAIKHFYTLAQFGATAACLFDDPTISFAPLLAIQAAPLLMTLVRKGKASSATYHRIYALSLFAGYIAIQLRWRNLLSLNQYDVVLKQIFVLAFPSSKIRRKTSALNVWLLNVALTLLIYPYYIQPFVDTHIIQSYFSSSPVLFAKILHTLAFVKNLDIIPKIAPLFVSEKWKVNMTLEKHSDNSMNKSTSKKES